MSAPSQPAGIAPAAAAEERPLDVLLASMPFGPLEQPSIGLGLLQGALVRRGIPVRSLYFTLAFARRIGFDDYNEISTRTRSYDLVGEWVFSRALFPGRERDDTGYMEGVVRGGLPEHAPRSTSLPVPEALVGRLESVRETAEAFLEDAVAEVVRLRPRILGLTSIFQQHAASLALARRVKEELPETYVVMGGANCEGPMGVELVRRFPFLDAVVSGEGDLVFPQLVERVLAGAGTAGLTGVHTRAGALPVQGGDGCANAPSVMEMDVLPYPEYGDFFEQLAIHDPEGRLRPRLLFETSRGCWWGEKHHCTFCGLNGQTMRFRSKSAERAMAELVHLAESYPGNVSVVDNIMDMGYFRDFIPELARRDLGLSLFYEVKANLRKEQLRMMREAGIVDIQPGVESLSTGVLRIMRKGVSALQNVQLIKWCMELGVRPHWNVLWGFPGEQAADYEAMIELMPALSHLWPPQSVTRIRLDRFSPNFDQAEELGFANIKPYPAYGYVYDLPEEALARMAYYFTFDYADPAHSTGHAEGVYAAVDRWQEAFPTSRLFSVSRASQLVVFDQRPGAAEEVHVLSGVERELLRACDVIRSPVQLRKVVEEHTGRPCAEDELDELLAPLLERRFLVREGNAILGLVVPMSKHYPEPNVLRSALGSLRAAPVPAAAPELARAG